jgi:hypothetical protein
MRRLVGWLVLATVLAAACDDRGDSPSPSRGPNLSLLDRSAVRPAIHGPLGEGPTYRVTARIDPATGSVDLRQRIRIGPQREGAARFRIFPNLPAFDSGFRIDRATVDGRRVEPVIDRSLLRVPVRRQGRAVEVGLQVSYKVATVEPSAADALGGGDGLNPAKVGLLGRHTDGLALGHWLPLLIPPGSPDEPVPDGFGDIGNFPAGFFVVFLDVPKGWTVVTSGTRIDEEATGERVVYREEGVGLRDFSVYVGRGLREEEVREGRVRVRSHARAAEAEHLGPVARHAARALDALSVNFGPYAWDELDVVSVPLGSSVGGMEWPGAIWVSSDVFAGRPPGLGALGDLEGLEDLEALESGPLAELFGEAGLGSLLAGTGEQLTTLREWVVAHEVAHQWWHAMVGNDSMTSPVVDEPLAQFSSCLYWQYAHGDTAGDRVCDLHVPSQYKAMRQLGHPDAKAQQPSDAFSSSMQYGGVVYGKAPGFYRALVGLVGREAVVAALRKLVKENLFELTTAEELLGAMQQASPGRAGEIAALWDRWMRGLHGDEDLGVPTSTGATGQADLAQLQEMLEGLLAGGVPE